MFEGEMVLQRQLKGAPGWRLGLVATALLACDDAKTPVEVDDGVASVTVSAPRLELTTGDTVRLVAVARNAAGTALSGRVFAWASDRDDVASVDERGLVIGLGEGPAKISASTAGKSAHVNIVVNSAPSEAVAAVRIDPESVDLISGDTVRITAVALNGSGEPMPGRLFAWTTDRDDIASVDGAGLVTGALEGTAQITATTAGLSAATTVRVSAGAAPSLAGISPSSIQAGWGSFTLVAQGTGFRAGSRVLWNGQPLESVVIDPTEIRAAVRPPHVAAEGTVEVSVETPSTPPLHSNTLTFTVFPRPAHSVELRVPGNAVFLGNRVRLDAVARDQFGDLMTDRSIEWTSSDTTVARIQGGYLIGLAVGHVTLTASASPVSASMVFFVVDPPAVDVAFEASPSGFPELFVRSLDGNALLRRLQPPGTFGRQVTATRDGARLAFVGIDGTGNHDIYVMNRDGSGLARLTTEPAIDDQPEWSPDGQWLAFRSFRQGKSDIWVMRADGTQMVNLTYASAFVPEEYNDGPTWAPDGQRIAFSRGFGTGQSLVTVRPDGSDLRELVPSAGGDRVEPAWSPNGQVIAFRSYDRATQQSQVVLVSATTGQVVQYVGTALFTEARSPAWLDNEWVAVTARAYPGSSARSVALVRLGFGHYVVPMDREFGELAEPAAMSR